MKQSEEEAQRIEVEKKANKELLKIMKNLDQEKPQGWGFENRKVDQSAADEFEKHKHNLDAAIKKLEMQNSGNSHDLISGLGDTKTKELESQL